MIVMDGAIQDTSSCYRSGSALSGYPGIKPSYKPRLVSTIQMVFNTFVWFSLRYYSLSPGSRFPSRGQHSVANPGADCHQ
jgi:hypothetical protein